MLAMLPAVRAAWWTVARASQLAGGRGGGEVLVGTIDGAVHALSQAVIVVGGTRNGLNSAAADQGIDEPASGQSYVLVGWAGAPEEGAGRRRRKASQAPRARGAERRAASEQTRRVPRPWRCRPPRGCRVADTIILDEPNPSRLAAQGRTLKALSWLGQDADPRLRARSAERLLDAGLDQSDANSIVEGMRDQTYPDDQSSAMRSSGRRRPN